MLVTVRTPCRVSLLGGGTDYPSYLKAGNEGLILGGAINRHVYVTIKSLPPFHKHHSRIVYSRVEEVGDNSEVEHRAVKAALSKEQFDDGIELFYAADVPARSGLGTSSSFVVALLHALNAYRGLFSSNRGLARAATQLEQVDLQETVGSQDQILAAHGGLNVIRCFADDYSISPLPVSAEHSAELQSHLLLFFTGEHRISSDVASSYAPTLDQRIDAMRALVKLTQDGIRAVEDCDWERLGKLIHESWKIKMSLSDKVSSMRLSDLYVEGQIAGAFGGKVTGAGGGGCILFVAPPEKHGRIVNRLVGQGCVHIPFAFDREGSKVIYHET